MAQLKPCPFRSVELGRLFCALATQEGERSTSHVYNETCEVCQVARIRAAHPCKNLDIGLDIKSHRDRASIDGVLLACKAYKIGLPDTLPDCTPNCPEWVKDETIVAEPAEESEEAEGQPQA